MQPFIHDQLIELALQEDIQTGDVTTLGTIDAHMAGQARLMAKERLVFCGKQVFETVFRKIDPTVAVEWSGEDGQWVEPAAVIAIAKGPMRSILTGERTALNFVRRLSGIATFTRQFVDAVRDTGSQILDTRKTTPGWRELEKYAVRMGGGRNHRFSLSGGVMIKDNHIDAVGSLSAAVARARGFVPPSLKIEVEVRTLSELQEALSAGADMVLLDNMDLDTLREAVRIGKGKVLTEASGNVRLETIRAIAETGVDFISVGAITHSARAVDLSLKVTRKTC